MPPLGEAGVRVAPPARARVSVTRVPSHDAIGATTPHDRHWLSDDQILDKTEAAARSLYRRVSVKLLWDQQEDYEDLLGQRPRPL